MQRPDAETLEAPAEIEAELTQQANSPALESDLAEALASAAAASRKEFRKHFRRSRWSRRRFAALRGIIADWEAEHGELTPEEKADARRKLEPLS